MRPTLVLVVSTLVTLTSARLADAQCELEVLTPAAGDPDDRFGYDVAIDGRTLLVSAIGEDLAAPDGGAVFVYVHTDAGCPGDPTDDTWTLTRTLTASGAAPGDHFGHAMAVRDGLAAISSVDDGNGTVTLFVREDGCTPCDPFDDDWIEVDEIAPSIGTFRFGRSVDVLDGTIAVGTRESETAFVFERNDHGTPWDRFDDTWIETARITASDGGAGGPGASFSYAWSVALMEDMLLVGARRDDEGLGNSGSVYVYVRDDRGTPGDRFDDLWVETGKFIADPPVLGGQFGRDIAIRGDMAVVGASSADTADPGLAYVFGRDRGGTASAFDDVWRQVATLAPSDALPGDEFGQGVALWGDVAVVGSFKHDVAGIHRPGALYAYRRQDQGTLDPWDDTWLEVARLTASNPEDRDWLGINVAIEGNVLVGGGPMTNNPSSNVRPGKAVLFALDCESLVLDFETEDDFATPLENGQAIDTEFGHLVTITGTGNTNGLPPAIFDTAPGGQNDPSQDLDLLIDTGNALILQEQPWQTVPGFFDRPNDDARGGVPPGFTEDLLADGPPGFRVLDLRRSGPQAGFAAVTSVTETPGFDPGAVLELRLVFQGSAALDELRFVPMHRRVRGPGLRAEALRTAR